MTEARGLRATPYDVSLQTFEIGIYHKQISWIRSYLKGPALGSLNNRAQIFLGHFGLSDKSLRAIIEKTQCGTFEIATN